jgi:quercetin dioxygenase-like cupin family protein
MFTKYSSEGFIEKLPGVRLKTLAFGEKTLITNLLIAKGANIPCHNHIHEQTGFLKSGCLEFLIDGKRIVANPGDSWMIPGYILHGATAVEDSDVIEVFAPVREDYLPAK